MKLVPYYRVSYNGHFYEAGDCFEIRPEDAEIMSAHGYVIQSKAEKKEPAETTAESAAPATTAKRPGRPKKA